MLGQQIGHVLWSLSHVVVRSLWNQCVQGSTTTSSPTVTSSMHTLHSAFRSGPNIFSSSFFSSKLAIASSLAGPGALDCGAVPSGLNCPPTILVTWSGRAQNVNDEEEPQSRVRGCLRRAASIMSVPKWYGLEIGT